MKKKIKEAQKNSGIRIIAESPPNYNAMCPIFSLERIQQGDFCFSNLETGDKAAFADSIFKRRTLTWERLQREDRHKLGSEKISKESIKATIPKFITEDEQNFLALRFNGLKSMVGYKVNNIFYVLWFDPKFNLYKHS